MKYKREYLSLNHEAVYSEIKRLYDNGSLPKLVTAGLLSPKAVTYMHIVERVSQQQTRLVRTTNKVIISNVADEFKVSTATVYRAINVMRTPLRKCENNK